MLWYEGYEVDTSLAKTSVISHIKSFKDKLEQQIEKTEKRLSKDIDDPKEAHNQAIEEVAAKFARKRNPLLPRYSRQSLDDRTLAIASMLKLTTEGMSPEDIENVASIIERFLGMDQGRKSKLDGVGPWLETPPAESFIYFADQFKLSNMIANIANATEEELQLSRPICNLFLSKIALFSFIADAFSMKENAAGLAGIKDDPEITPMVLSLIIYVLRTSKEGLVKIIQALQTGIIPAEKQLKELAKLPPEELNKRIKNSKLPISQEAGIKKSVVKYRKS